MTAKQVLGNTGAARSSSRARRITRTARVVLVSTQALMVLGLAWRVPEYGLQKYSAVIVFTVFNLYITYPIMLGIAHLPKPMRAVRYIAETGLPGGRRKAA